MFTLIPLQLSGLASGAVTTFVVTPCRCTVKGMQAVCDADPGDAETITISDGTNDIGVLTYGTGIAAGATGTFTADSTNGDTVFAAGDTIQIDITQLTADTEFNGYIKIDEFARISQP